MKFLLPIAGLLATLNLGLGQTADRALAGLEGKRAAALHHCPHGHETLRDVPVVYGHMGDAMSHPEIAAKVKAGDLILGGCVLGYESLVVCKTCGLQYDDSRDSWKEEHLPFEPAITIIRGVISNGLEGFPLEIAGNQPSPLSCFRWLMDTGTLAGEQASFSTKAKPDDVLAAFTTWLKTQAPGLEPIPPSPNDCRRWEWRSGSRELSLFLLLGHVESLVSIGWRQGEVIETAEPPPSHAGR